MIRKLAVALSFLCAGFSGWVYALGLGEVTVNSALNQPLSAEIELVNVGDLEATEVLPGLATREEFLRAGVDRVYFLSDIRFEVIRNANGKLGVVLTTNKPVREPYLNFLVEVIWPSGRLLREYALLIDPPLFAEEEPPVVAAPAPVTQAAPESRSSQGDTLAVPRNPVTATPTTIQGGTYGPTAPTDTLWDIAMKARPDRSVSPQQVMLAIQDLNPDAFIDDNINKLKAGQVLRLPNKEDMQRRSTAQAINEVIAQNEALQPRKRTSVVSSDTSPAPASRSASGSAGSVSGDELKLVVADSGSASSSAGGGEGVAGGTGSGDAPSDTEMALTLEKLDKANIENQELNTRVEDLEEQLETLQRLLTLKNDQLASVQEQMRENEMARLEAEQADGESATDSIDGMQEPNLDTDTAPEEGVVDAPEEGVVSTPAAEDEKAIEVEQSKPEAAATPKDTLGVPAQRQQSLVEMILSNPLYLALVGLGILVLLVLLWLLSRHNAAQERKLQEEMQNRDGIDEGSAADVFEEPVAEEQDNYEEELAENEEALFPEETLEGGSVAAEPSEESAQEQEDVIAEADVYIAYGRLDQAAHILEEAISREPVRTDYRLKLLEVYKDSDNAAAFERQFSELEAIQDAEALEQANRIRADFQGGSDSDYEPELDVFEDAGAAEPEVMPQEAKPTAAAGEEDLPEPEDMALDEPVDNSFNLDTVDSLTEEDDIELDVDLSSEDLDLDVDVDIDLESASAGETLSGSLEVDDSELDAAINKIDQDLSEDLDLELDDIDLSDELESESEIDLPNDLSIPDELTQMDEPLEDDAEIVNAASEAKVEIPEAPDKVVSDDILDEAVEALSDADDFDADLEGDDFDFLEGTDEASTKLDLARAYIDMGDIDGARDILQEVASEGSAEQQAEAKDLLGSLGD